MKHIFTVEDNMPLVDKDFVANHYEEIKTILNDIQADIDKCSVSFEESSVQFFLSSNHNADVCIDAKQKLLTLCNQHNTVFSITVSALEILGQPTYVPLNAVLFKNLNPEKAVADNAPTGGFGTLWSQPSQPDDLPRSNNPSKNPDNGR